MKNLLLLALSIIFISCTLKEESGELIDSSKITWITSVEKAQEIAAENNQVIFAFFTGKEWCGWCKKLDREVLTKEAFINYANENLVMLELDFPRGRRDLPQSQIDLSRKFKVEGYPTVILMDADANFINRTGYQGMNPEAYIKHIERLLAKK